MLRLLFVPVFWWLLYRDQIALAGWLVGIIAATDWVDGYLARRLNQVTNLGKALDPVADRLIIASAVIGGLIVGVVPLVFGWLLILREAIMAGLAIVLSARGADQLVVRRAGKVATFLVYFSIPAFYIAESGQLEWIAWPVAWGAGVIGLILYYIVMIRYFGDARVNLSAVESRPGPEEA